ncbi:MAG: L-ascorbate metabolism protein UlaG (beta-lactamase superfamily) [Planctomycetota bacterium]|jgi:L-ascorbate metabolism protein UlaG (beta-lactamase superfamily)
MIITYHGNHFIKITYGETTVAINPPSLSVEKKVSRFGADVVICSTLEPLMHGIETVTYGDRAPFVVDGPGEYEVGEVFIRGYLTKTSGGASLNTAYVLRLEDMQIICLGDIVEKDAVPPAMREAIEDADIVIVPAREGGGLAPGAAYGIARTLGAKLIIPVAYSKASLEIFLKEGGGASETTAKATLKKKDLTGREADIFVITE